MIDLVHAKMGGPLYSILLFKLAKRGGGGYPQALSEVVTLWDARAFIGLPSISTIECDFLGQL